MSVPSNVENSDFPHKYFTDTSTYLWPIFLIKLADNFFTVSSFFHKTRITFFHQKGLGGIMTRLMIDIQVLPISRLRLKCSFMSETYICSYIKIINKMITAEQPKINNIFPFLEWNILIFLGLFLIERIYVTIDTANNPKDPNITRISNLSYLLKNVPTA